jgi:hypothetical protein
MIRIPVPAKACQQRLRQEQVTIAGHELHFVQQLDRWQQESKSLAASSSSRSQHILRERQRQQNTINTANEHTCPANSSGMVFA